MPTALVPFVTLLVLLVIAWVITGSTIAAGALLIAGLGAAIVGATVVLHRLAQR